MKKNDGYIAFSSLLVISAVILAAAILVSLASISESQMGYSLRKGEETLFFVEGCLEEALMRAKESGSYEGGLLNLPEGQCTINISKDQENWTLLAIGSKGRHTRKVEAQIRRGCDQIELYSWSEVE